MKVAQSKSGRIAMMNPQNGEKKTGYVLYTGYKVDSDAELQNLLDGFVDGVEVLMQIPLKFGAYVVVKSFEESKLEIEA